MLKHYIYTPKLESFRAIPKRAFASVRSCKICVRVVIVNMGGKQSQILFHKLRTKFYMVRFTQKLSKLYRKMLWNHTCIIIFVTDSGNIS